MKILVTGAKGFVGKNLIATLENIRDGKDKSFGIANDIIVYPFDRDTPKSLLDEYCKDCNFVFNLAGVNRPKDKNEFMEGNFGFTSELLETLNKYQNKAPIVISSSIQAKLDNDYGLSKKAGEDLVFEYGRKNNTQVFVYRFPNLFGKWCKPNYNSVIATFCYNVANDLEIKVNDQKAKLNLAYIDDVINEFINVLKNKANKNGNYCEVTPTYDINLGEIAELIKCFKKGREDKTIPNVTKGGFETKLYSTYLSYLPTDKFSYPLKMNIDERGSFTEILRTLDRGQFSVNISKVGITKGEHWHHSKNEKFVVVSGKGLIQFRKIDEEKVIEYHVSGDKIEVVDIPTGYTHNIINEGATDLVTFMWCNECFNPEKPDTYFLKVVEDKNVSKKE